MFENIAAELENELRRVIRNRERKVSDHLLMLQSNLDEGNHKGAYGQLAEIARHTEHLSQSLRDALLDLYGALQTGGLQPAYHPFHAIPDVDVYEENGCVIIKSGGMMPFPLRGNAYYLHDKLNMALERFYEEQDPPRPYFTERCAVVFIHHYGSKWADLRHLRDYDNVERRCITNVIASCLLWGDSPKCMISMDALAPGDSNYTEIRIMPMPQFRTFVMSENIEYVP